jgi:hypothetical protein
MDQETLVAEQKAMKQRQIPRRGAVAGQPRKRAPVGSDDEFRAFISAHCLLQRGWSLSRVSAQTQINHSRLERWHREGHPLVFDY